MDIEEIKKEMREVEKENYKHCGPCECCGEDGRHHAQQVLQSNYDYKARYRVCGNCLISLVNCSLTPAQFFNLLQFGHTTNEFLLHGDFYDEETGKALQPMR